MIFQSPKRKPCCSFVPSLIPPKRVYKRVCERVCLCARVSLYISRMRVCMYGFLIVTDKINQFRFLSWKTHHFHFKGNSRIRRNSSFSSRSRTSLGSECQFTRNIESPTITNSHQRKDLFDTLDKSTRSNTCVVRFGSIKNIINLHSRICHSCTESNGSKFTNFRFGSISTFVYCVRHTTGSLDSFTRKGRKRNPPGSCRHSSRTSKKGRLKKVLTRYTQFRSSRTSIGSCGGWSKTIHRHSGNTKSSNNNTHGVMKSINQLINNVMGL
mmetsp:Transcript_16908/g.22208  ORF Transcript_16908/g.22208 Transcript_16908/m.22208 type:complete len:269 (-) Transcript_16908:41-847(-)